MKGARTLRNVAVLLLFAGLSVCQVYADTSLTATLTPTDAAPGDLFGAATALGDNIVVVGAPGKNDSAGVVYARRSRS